MEQGIEAMNTKFSLRNLLKKTFTCKIEKKIKGITSKWGQGSCIMADSGIIGVEIF